MRKSKKKYAFLFLFGVKFFLILQICSFGQTGNAHCSTCIMLQCASDVD